MPGLFTLWNEANLRPDKIPDPVIPLKVSVRLLHPDHRYRFATCAFRIERCKPIFRRIRAAAKAVAAMGAVAFI
jgi:hypothetical protein